MIKNIIIFFAVTIFIVFVVQYFLEKYIRIDEQQTNLQTTFKRDLTESLSHLSSLSDCNLNPEGSLAIAECLQDKSNESLNKIQAYSSIDGCIGDIAREVISITELVTDFSSLSLQISKSGTSMENERAQAAGVLNDISTKINNISELNNQDICLLDKID
jgi:hypothetical protein